ncbi:MAG TPA: hypothetical protein VKM54_29660 [Myxococcota bacterium]|nr:hypothetical protein [Myxococcota bacterium]
MQKDHPDPLGHTRNKIECIAHFLLGLADLLDLVVVKLKEFALYLIEEVAPRFSDEGGAAA